MIWNKKYTLIGMNDEVFEALEKTTVIKSSDSPTGYVVSFRFPGEGLEKVWLDGDWIFSDVYHSSHYTSANLFPHEWHKECFAHSAMGFGMGPRDTTLKPHPAKGEGNGLPKGPPAGFRFTPEMILRNAYEMKKNANGYFVCTIPLPSGIFNYLFITSATEEKITRVPDPSNPPFDKVPGEQHNSQIYVPFDAEKQLNDRSIECPFDCAQKGNAFYIDYPTDNVAEMESPQPLGIYLPYGYDASRVDPYPVLYLSHGGGGNESDWFSQGAACQILDHLIAEGKLKPMIVVTPDHSRLGFDNDYKCIPNLMLNIIPYMEANYNVEKTPAGRAFAGLSMGGFLTTDLYFSHAADFGYFCIMSGGRRFIEDLENPDLKLPTIMIGAGQYDDAFFSYGYKLQDDLTIVGIKFTSLFPNGGHQWSVWRILLEKFCERVLWK